MKRKKIISIVLLITIICLFIPSFKSTEAAKTNDEPKFDGIYYIKSKVGSNMYLDISGGSKDDGANVQIWEKSDVDQQKYEIKYSDGYYTIKPIHSKKVLDVACGSNANGTNVQQYSSNNSDAQKWTIKSSGDGNSYTIVSKLSANGKEKVLDVAGGTAQSGTNVQLFESNGSKAQTFEIINVSGNSSTTKPAETPKQDKNLEGTYKIKSNVGSNMYLDISGGSKEDGANLQIWEESNVDQQKFKVKNLNNGYYTIEAVHSNKVLDVACGSNENGANVQQYKSNGSDAQKWLIKDTGDGKNYTIVSKLSANGKEKVLDVAGGTAQSGTNVQLFESNGSRAQTFELVNLTGDTSTPKPSEEPKTPETPSTDKKGKELPDGDYIINSGVGNNMVLDISGTSKANEANLQIWENANVKNQKFHVRKQSDGLYTIRAVHSKKALDVEGAKRENSTNVRQYDYNGSDAQKWIIKDTGDGEHYTIISKCNNLALDIAGGTAESGINVQVYKSNNSKAQTFTFTPTEYQEIDNGIYEIQMKKNKNKIFDIAGGSTASDAKVQIWDRSQVNQQKFQVTYNSDKTYTIEAAHSEKVLDVPGGTAKASEQIQQCESNGTNAQKWKIKDLGDGNYNIISKCGDMYLDVGGGSTANGSHVQLYEGNGTEAQLFQFVETKKILEGTQEINTLDDAQYPGFKAQLQQVKNAHPNWDIKVYYTGLNWDDVLTAQEQGTRSLTDYSGAWRKNNVGYDVSGGWYLATRQAIAYMMDARNSFDDYIFQFQDLASSSGTYNEIQRMVSSRSYLNNPSCINAIIQAAQQNGISPFHIASRIMQECGKNGGSMYGYTHESGRKVYNLYNISVSGNGPEGLRKGAQYAYDRGWFTPEASIKGGAEFLKTNYISKGQTTLYFQKYNVVNKSNLYSNQYMQNIRAANDEGKTMCNSYRQNGLLEGHFSFLIPVYNNMPATPCARP